MNSTQIALITIGALSIPMWPLWALVVWELRQRRKLDTAAENKPVVAEGTRFCINCEHCIRDPNRVSAGNMDFSQCARTGKPKAQSYYYLVTGVDTNRGGLDYNYCSVERNHTCEGMCGPEGKYYKEKTNA